MPAPKPAALKLREGNRGHRRIRTNELKGRGKPRCPGHLTDLEKACWRSVVASLPPDTLTAADEQILERMATAWAQFRAACEGLRKSSTIVRGDRGQAVRSPLLIVKNQAAQEMNSCGIQLGLSPLSRTRLSEVDPIDDDPLAILLGTDGKWSDDTLAH